MDEYGVFNLLLILILYKVIKIQWQCRYTGLQEVAVNSSVIINNFIQSKYLSKDLWGYVCVEKG